MLQDMKCAGCGCMLCLVRPHLQTTANVHEHCRCHHSTLEFIMCINLHEEKYPKFRVEKYSAQESCPSEVPGFLNKHSLCSLTSA